MYRSERWPEEAPEPPPPPPPQPRSRSSSRRSSASLSRRSSLKKDKEAKKSPLNSAPPSASSTPKKTAKPQNLEFLVTGKQIVKRADRANSLPGSYHRRQSVDVAPRGRKLSEAPKRAPPAPPSPKSHESYETTLEEDMSLDLSQVSDFEDTNSKYGIRNKFATSTPLPTLPPVTPATPAPAGRVRGKPRSASLQSQIHAQRVETRRAEHSLDHSNKQSLTSSRDSSVFNTSTSISSPYRGGAELDYSSVSPEYSGQSSADLSPRTLPTRASQQALSPRSQALSSCCVSTWAECSEAGDVVGAVGAVGTGGAVEALDGEWCAFWANYNNSLPSVPVKGYYDRCPTPYRTETVDLADWEFSDGSRKRSPDNNAEVINNIIRNQGLHLTPRETQNIIKCAHLLGNVLSKAIDRRSKTTDDPELLTKKKTMTLDLKETSIPLEVKEEKKCETATTQTDISLPNTKSAPRIFENILRQLSRSSIDVKKIENKEKSEVNTEAKSDSGDVKGDNQATHEIK